MKSMVAKPVRARNGLGLQGRATVGHVLHSLDVGGAEVLAARLGRRLSEHYRVVFFCLDRVGDLGKELRRDGFSVHLVTRRASLDWQCALRLSALMRREKVDLIHAHQYAPFLYGLLARLVYRRPAIIFHEHGRAFPDYPRRKRILANRLLLQARDRMIGVGEAVRQALIHNEGLPADRVDVIYNGIDLTPQRFNEIDRTVVRRQLDLAPDNFMILQVARLDAIKDHATALRTLEHLLGKHPKAVLVIAGEGPEKQRIEDWIAQYQLQSSVRLLGLRRDVPLLLAAADVFLLTSVSEGIPLTVIEAMAAGLPVVATDVGGLAEVVQPDVTGLLAPSGDDQRLAEHLHTLAQNPSMRRTMGLEGKMRARELFEEEAMNARYEQLYQEMVS